MLIGQRVLVNVELVNGFEEYDTQLQNVTGIIASVDNWIFPYEVQLEDQKLNNLLKFNPRRFAKYELKAI